MEALKCSKWVQWVQQNNQHPKLILLLHWKCLKFKLLSELLIGTTDISEELNELANQWFTIDKDIIPIWLEEMNLNQSLQAECCNFYWFQCKHI